MITSLLFVVNYNLLTGSSLLALGKSFCLFLVTDISELEQRIRDLPLHSDKAVDEDIISVASEGSSEPSDYRPWENHADRALLPSCKFINKN